MFTLSEKEKRIYVNLNNVVHQRRKNTENSRTAQAAQSASQSTEIPFLTEPPHVAVFTDLGKDLDDALALLVLEEYNRLGLIKLEAIIANLHPEEKRAWFAEGAARSLGLNVWVGRGTAGSNQKHKTDYYEFDPNHAKFMSPDGYRDEGSGQKPLLIYQGIVLFQGILNDALAQGRKITLLLLSSLTDIAAFIKLPGNKDLFLKTVSEVVMQGGYEVKNGIIEPAIDPQTGAMNNKFDPEAATYFHRFLQTKQIKSTVYTKAAAVAAPVEPAFFDRMADTGHSIGQYLRNVKVEQDVVFYVNSCSPTPQYMSRDSFLKFKTSLPENGWENAPIGRGIIPWLTGAFAYDALAALHVGGADVRQVLGYIDQASIDSQTNCYKSPIHKVIGFQPVGPYDTRPKMSHLHKVRVSTVLSSLFMGALLATLDADKLNVGYLKAQVLNAAQRETPNIQYEMQYYEKIAKRYEKMRLNSKGKVSS